MFIDVYVSLVAGTDPREFVNSFSSNDVVLFHAPENAPVATLIRKDFLETVAEDSRVEKIKVLDSGDEERDIDYPEIKYQQGTVTVTSTPTSSEDLMPFTRPLFGSSDSVAYQKVSLIANQQKNYLGNHFMGKQMTTNLPHRHNDPTGQSTRPTVGRSIDDTYRYTGPFGHTLNPLTEKTETQYESRFFGKDVDILVLEPTWDFGYVTSEDFNLVDHPEWGLAPENDPNILGNDGLGDAPNGAYNYVSSRLNLKDWKTHYKDINNNIISEVIPSTGTSLGGRGSMLSRYLNTNLGKKFRAPMDYHMTMCLSLAGGTAGGYAKKANLYPIYLQSSMGFKPVMDDIIDFHQNKPINPETGVQNPTILSNSWGSGGRRDHRFYAPVNSINQINHLGTTINRPSEGWGSDLTPFVDSHLIPTRFKNPTSGQWEWVVPLPSGAISDASIEVRDALYLEEFRAGIPLEDRTTYPISAGVNTRDSEQFIRAWEAGITVVQSAGNTPTPYARPEQPEYNSSFLLDVGAEFFEHVLGFNGIEEFTPITVIPEDEFFWFRPYNKGHPVNTVIVVAAGYMSDASEGLDGYSNRGPAIDIIGDGRGCVMAYTQDGQEFPADSPFGLGAPLETTNAMYSSVPYPFQGASAGASEQTFTNPSLGLEEGWLEDPRETDYNGDGARNGNFLYETHRTFTSDGVGQDSSWSTPSVVAKQGHAEGGPFEGQDLRTAEQFFVLYRKNDNTITATEDDNAYSSLPYRGMDGWSPTIPELTDEGDIIYRTQVVFNDFFYTSDGFIYNQWEEPVIVARRTGGRDIKLVTLYKENAPVVRFEGGDRVRITSVGSNPPAWATYLGTANTPLADWKNGLRYELTSLGTGTDAENQAALNAYYQIQDFSVPGDNAVRLAVSDHRRFEIVNLGTHSDPAEIQLRWNNYLGTENVTYSVGHIFTAPTDTFELRYYDIGCVVRGVHQVGDVIKFESFRVRDKTILDNLAGVTGDPFGQVGDTFTLPASINTNAPPGATVSRIGHRWARGGGTSAATPSVAGRLACMAEEYFHTYGKWPTNNELRGLMLNSAKRVDIQNRLVDWSNTPPASDVEVSTSPYQVFFNSKFDSSRNEIGRIRFWENANRGAIWNFSRREGKIGPSGIGWRPENTPSTTFTINLSSIASSSTTSVKEAEYALYKDEKYGLEPDNVKTFESTLVSIDDTGFKDSNNQPVTFTEGDVLQVGGTYNEYIDRGTYAVVEYDPPTTGNPAILKIEQKNLRLNKFSSPGVSLDWSTIPSVISGLTFTVSYVKTTEKNNIEHYLKLQNESGQSEGAGAYCYLNLQPGAEYKISVDSDKPVKVTLDKMSSSPTSGDFTLSNELTFSSILGSGTITPHEAKTSVMLAGVNELNYASNALLWEQMERAGFDFDKNGAADALTDGLLFLRYLFDLTGDALLDSAVGPNETATDDEIVENLRIAVKTFGDIDGNGTVDALTDGLLLLRYLFDLTGDALIDSAVAENAVRTTAEQIISFIEKNIPKKSTTIGTFGYRSVTNSAVKNDWPTKDFGRQILESQDILADVQEGLYTFEEADQISLERQYMTRIDNVSLTRFSNPVGVEMFDNDYMVSTDLDRTISYQSYVPYTAYPGTAWRWTKPSGQFFTSDMGELSQNFFVDVAGNTRAINDMWWTNGQDSWTEYDRYGSTGVSLDRPLTPKGIFCFSIAGTNVPNTAQTFSSIKVNGVRFKRTDAYYHPSSNGSSVWWWHITCRPFADSQFQKLGRSVSDWFIENTLKNEVHFTNSHTDDDNYYKLCLKNPTNVTGLTTLVNSVHVLRKQIPRQAKTIQPHTIHPPGEPSLDRFIPGFGNDTKARWMSGGSHRSYEACGTPPLRAHYIPGSIEKGEVSPIGSLSSNITPTAVTQGAIFPSQVNTLSATNDITKLEAGVELTKYGWQRQKPEPFTIRNLGKNSEPFSAEAPPVDRGSPADSGYYSIKISASSLLSDPSVPSNGTFTLGPIVAKVSPSEELDFHPVFFQWQKSTNGTTWTDISSTDTTYTNAQTNTLTVTNYSGQSPVGDYYRCKVSTLGINASSQYTNIVKAKAG